MKKILATLLVVLLSAETAIADSCSANLLPLFTANQATKLCAYFVNTASLSGSLTFTGSGPIIAPTKVAIAAGAASTPNYNLDNTGIHFVNSGMSVAGPAYVPTMAATPASGTNDLKVGYNAVPTAAANTSACLPLSPQDGDLVVVENGMANAVRPKSCSTPGVNGGAAGTYMSVPAWARAVLRYNSSLTTWFGSLQTVPTPAGP